MGYRVGIQMFTFPFGYAHSDKGRNKKINMNLSVVWSYNSLEIEWFNDQICYRLCIGHTNETICYQSRVDVGNRWKNVGHVFLSHLGQFVSQIKIIFTPNEFVILTIKRSTFTLSVNQPPVPLFYELWYPTHRCTLSQVRKSPKVGLIHLDQYVQW